MQSLNVSDVTSILIVIITLVYTVGTFLLFFLQKKSLNLVSKQIELMLNQSKSQSYHNIINNHREIITTIVSNKKVLDTISNNFGFNNNKFTNNFIATLFINHVFTVYVDYENNILTEEQWSFAKIDILDLFCIKFIKNRWEQVQEFYPQNFTKTINNILQK